MAKLLTCLVLVVFIQFSNGDLDTPYTGLLMKMDEYPMPPLLYNLTDLEPYIDGKTMNVHFSGHLGGYRSKTNALLAKLRQNEPDNPMATESILTIMMNLDKVHEDFRADIRFFGGGFVNHCFYFGIMSATDEDEAKAKPREPEGDMLKEINQNFGSFEELRKKMEVGMRNLHGSGYIWMVRVPGKKGEGSLKVITTSNQDSPVMEGLHPLICIDMWEHAYYLKHNYKKWDHLKDFWMVIDWNYIGRLDKWWGNLVEEQKKADDRISAFVKGNKDREQRKKERTEKEKAEKKSKSEL